MIWPENGLDYVARIGQNGRRLRFVPPGIEIMYHGIIQEYLAVGKPIGDVNHASLKSTGRTGLALWCKVSLIQFRRGAGSRHLYGVEVHHQLMVSRLHSKVGNYSP